MSVERVGEDRLKLSVGKKEIEVFTEDLAALVRSELPEDRARELFSEIESTALSSGKARVAVTAQKDIKKASEVCKIVKLEDRLNNLNSITSVWVW
jgi:hypothetical protein